MLRRKVPDPAREALREYYRTCALAKVNVEAEKADRAETRQETAREARVRVYVFARERNLCRVCRLRAAVSRHELRFRSLGGKVTRENCVAVCGDGVHGCHGHLQAHRILYDFETPIKGAEGTILFPVNHEFAAEWLRVLVGHVLVSPPMVEIEEAV